MKTRNWTMFYNFNNRNDGIYGMSISIEHFTFCSRDRKLEIFTHIKDAIKFEGYHFNNISINHYIGFELFQNKGKYRPPLPVSKETHDTKNITIGTNDIDNGFIGEENVDRDQGFIVTVDQMGNISLHNVPSESEADHEFMSYLNSNFTGQISNVNHGSRLNRMSQMSVENDRLLLPNIHSNEFFLSSAGINLSSMDNVEDYRSDGGESKSQLKDITQMTLDTGMTAMTSRKVTNKNHYNNNNNNSNNSYNDNSYNPNKCNALNSNIFLTSDHTKCIIKLEVNLVDVKSKGLYLVYNMYMKSFIDSNNARMTNNCSQLITLLSSTDTKHNDSIYILNLLILIEIIIISMIKMYNGNEHSEINTEIGKLIMQLNNDINGININLFNIVDSLNSVQINTYVLALILDNGNVSLTFIMQIHQKFRVIKRIYTIITMLLDIKRENIISPPTPGGEPCEDSNHPCTTASAALLSRQRQTIFILLILAFGLLVCDIIPRGNVIFDVENNGLNVLYEYECEFYCDALSSHISNASDTINAATATSCNGDPGCVALGEFNVNGCDVSVGLPATTIATIVGIENEIIFHSSDTPHTPQPGPDVTAPPHPTPQIIDKTRAVGIGLPEFKVNEYVFIENEFNNGINNIFDIYFNENYHDNDISKAYYYYATTATDENENKKKPERGANGPVTNTQTEAKPQRIIAQVIDIIDEMVAISKGSRGFDNIDCIFSGSL